MSTCTGTPPVVFAGSGVGDLRWTGLHHDTRDETGARFQIPMVRAFCL